MEIDLEQEIAIAKKLSQPHLSYVEDTLQNRKNVSYLVLQKREVDILLIDSFGFSIDSVLAGLTERHIEYIAKNAPQIYKSNIVNALRNKETMEGLFSIAKAMDEDLNGTSQQNQLRIQHVIQYIKDNLPAFQF